MYLVDQTLSNSCLSFPIKVIIRNLIIYKSIKPYYDYYIARQARLSLLYPHIKEFLTATQIYPMVISGHLLLLNDSG